MGANPFSNEELDELRANLSTRGARVDNYEHLSRLLATLDVARDNLAAQVTVKRRLHESYSEARRLLQEHQDAHGTADTHSGASSDTEDQQAQQWRRRRDALLSGTP